MGIICQLLVGDGEGEVCKKNSLILAVPIIWDEDSYWRILERKHFSGKSCLPAQYGLVNSETNYRTPLNPFSFSFLHCGVCDRQIILSFFSLIFNFNIFSFILHKQSHWEFLLQFLQCITALKLNKKIKYFILESQNNKSTIIYKLSLLQPCAN